MVQRNTSLKKLWSSKIDETDIMYTLNTLSSLSPQFRHGATNYFWLTATVKILIFKSIWDLGVSGDLDYARGAVRIHLLCCCFFSF